MARRSVWLVTGVVAGAASSLYAERRLKRTLEAASARLAPDALVTEVGRSARQAARSTGGRVREAVATGRSAMQRREDELWADLAASGAAVAADGSGAVADPPTAPAPSPAAGSTAPTPGDAPPTAVPAGAVGHAGRTGRRRRARRSPSHLGK